MPATAPIVLAVVANLCHNDQCAETQIALDADAPVTLAVPDGCLDLKAAQIQAHAARSGPDAGVDAPSVPAQVVFNPTVTLVNTDEPLTAKAVAQVGIPAEFEFPACGGLTISAVANTQ